MTFEEWVLYGVNRGYCTDVSCYTHDGFILTEEENAEFDEGGDPCVPVLRVWNTTEQQLEHAVDNGYNTLAYELCSEMNKHIVGNGYTAFKINKTSVSAMERILRIDKRSAEEVKEMISWSQTHEFWLHNIRSPEKLRKHFDTMLGQRRRDKRSTDERRVVVELADRRVEESMRAVQEKLERERREAVPMPTDIRQALRKKK